PMLLLVLAAVRQPRPRLLRLVADKMLENSLQLGVFYPDSAVTDRDGDAPHHGLAGVDPDLAWAVRGEDSGLCSVDDEVHDDLSELNGISKDGRQRLSAREAHRDVLALHVAPEQIQHVVDQRVDVHRGALRMFLAEQGQQPLDRLRSALGILGDIDERVIDLTWLRLLDGR